MSKQFFQNKKVNFHKLIDYGFVKKDKGYEYVVDLLDGDFALTVFVNLKGELKTKVIDKNSKEEYFLYLIKESGGFVGKVRTAVDGVLQDISDKCFETEVYKSLQAKKVIQFVKAQWGDELEFLWEKFPSDSIWRRKDNKKWYGLMIKLPKSKLGDFSDEMVEILDFRINPEEKEQIVDGIRIFEAYHMNKKSWATICLDGSVPNEEIFDRLKTSYELAMKK